MHGLIFTSFRDYLTEEHGAELAREVFAEEPIYLLSEAYPDERLTALVARSAEITGRDVEDVVHDFGFFTGSTTFTKLYPAFFAAAPSARDFLLTVEVRIHELVRATIPNATPPELRVSELGADGVAIDYSSPRQLCVLLRGLAEGDRTPLRGNRAGRRGDVHAPRRPVLSVRGEAHSARDRRGLGSRIPGNSEIRG